jgi:phosphatidylcholine synthase
VSAGRRAAAFSVHIFTASGAALAFIALEAAVERRWSVTFAWLALALVVDGVDGALARWLNVRATVPRWSGDTLDLVVDILTYVLVPAYAIAAAGLLPASLSTPLAALILMTSVIYFADLNMKDRENYFVGFPAVWNIVAFYLFLLRPNPWVAAGIVVTLSALTFVPLPFVHPLRVQKAKLFNALLLGLSAVLGAVALATDLAPGTVITSALCALAAYFLCFGLFVRRA